MGATADLEASQLKGSETPALIRRSGTGFCFSPYVEPCSFRLREVHFPEKRRFQKKGLVDVHPGHAVPAL